MLGETTFGTWVAYGAICLVLLVFIVMFVRLALMMSLLFIAPVAAIARRIPGLRRPDTGQRRDGPRAKPPAQRWIR